jgi:dimethylglycine dehydrogenase
MRTHAQAVVIGGGLIGCSILYHLAKLGWTDVVLLERDELTSGSTWHAAANIHGLHDNTNISRLQHYTMALYKELQTETGQGCGIFQPGSLYLAQTEAREHQLRLQAAKARRYKHELLRDRPARGRALHPLVDFDGIRCIMYEPEGGNVDPSGVTRLCRGRAPARRRDPPLHAGDRHRGAAGRKLDRAHAERATSIHVGWSMPPACGARGGGAWRASNCR